MSEQSPPPQPETFRHETQSERRLKYGVNVAVAIIAAIVVSGVLVYIVQTHDRRIDTTAAGAYSLKPQTRNIISDLKDKVTLVSLYTRTKPPEQDNNTTTASDQNAPAAIDQAQVVADLLDEYRRDGKSIDVEIIDPNTEKDKLGKLHDELVVKYGKQIQGYKDFLVQWDADEKKLADILTAEDAKMGEITGNQPVDDNDETPIGGFQADLVRTIKKLPRIMGDAKKDIDEERAKKYPDWKKTVSALTDWLQKLSDQSEVLAKKFAAIKGVKGVPANVLQFATDSESRFEQIKATAEGLTQRASKLGELKLGQLEADMNVENPILVLGPDDWRVLQQRQVWLDDKAMRDPNGVKIQPRFAGEQQVTAAIYSLTTNSKPKVCFVRPSGQPLTPAGFPPFIQGGPMSEIADRLKMYNFQITEKDLSGTWAAQAQMQQQMPSAPEPSDEEIKDAIWVVLDMGHEMNGAQEQQGMPPMPVGPKVKQHLDQGGSALIIFGQQDDDMSGALESWGIQLHPNTMVVHEAVHLQNGSPNDIVEDFKAHPTDFIINEYGNHPITRAVQSLDSIWVPTMAVTTTTVSDATATSLIPMDNAYPGLKVWGSNSIDAMHDGGDPVFDSTKDMPGPVYGMAVSEKKNGGRVVVMGSPLMVNGRIDIPDPAIYKKEGRIVNRFPGNGELATDSLFWLAHLDTMIAISPAAMDVSRISPIGHGALNFWRIGVLLILLPGAVIAAGLFVYAGRRD
jgi:hypothetical protein